MQGLQQLEAAQVQRVIPIFMHFTVKLSQEHQFQMTQFIRGSIDVINRIMNHHPPPPQQQQLPHDLGEADNVAHDDYDSNINFNDNDDSDDDIMVIISYFWRKKNRKKNNLYSIARSTYQH